MKPFLQLLSLAFSLTALAQPAATSAEVPNFEAFAALFERARSSDAADPENTLRIEAPQLRAASELHFWSEWDPQSWGREGRLGAMHFMIGDLEAAPTRGEMEMFFGMLQWALDAGFTAYMDPAATNDDLRESVRSPDLSTMIWSSHGSRDGRVWDANKTEVAQDSFADQASEHLKYYVFSNCYSGATVQRYALAPDAGYTYWEETTNSSDLKAFLYSELFNERLRNAGIEL
jgi:hypothetical protein